MFDLMRGFIRAVVMLPFGFVKFTIQYRSSRSSFEIK